jgi:hypothetical protein
MTIVPFLIQLHLELANQKPLIRRDLLRSPKQGFANRAFVTPGGKTICISFDFD